MFTQLRWLFQVNPNQFCNTPHSWHVFYHGSISRGILKLTVKHVIYYVANLGCGYLIQYSDWLRAGWSGDRIPVGARFSAPVQTGSGAHQASCTVGTGAFQGVKIGRGVKLTPHPRLVPWSRKSRTIHLLPLWAVRPVQNLSACTRVHFTLLLI